MIIYGALRDLVPFVQFKKREKYLWRSVTFSLLKITLLHECFLCFVNCTNGIKSRKASHVRKRIQIPTEASLKTLCVHHSLERISETYLVINFQNI